MCEGSYLNSFYEVSITWITKPDKDIKEKIKEQIEFSHGYTLKNLNKYQQFTINQSKSLYKENKKEDYPMIFKQVQNKMFNKHFVFILKYLFMQKKKNKAKHKTTVSKPRIKKNFSLSDLLYLP